MGNCALFQGCSSINESHQMTICLPPIEQNENITVQEQFDNPQREVLTKILLHTSIKIHESMIPKNYEEDNSLKQSTFKTLLKPVKQPSSKMSVKEIYQLLCPTLKRCASGIDINLKDFIYHRKENVKEKYQFLEFVGQGSYGKVWKAQIKKTRELRAIKIIKKDKFAKNAQQIQFMKGFDHPNIIQLYEIYEYGNYFYVVTEFCQGGSVVNFIQNHIHRLNENLARQVIKQILEALVYLHDLQIIHRDIKLENIVFVEDDGQQSAPLNIKIIDFGAAMKLKFTLNKEKRIVGTYSYMSPESFYGMYSCKTDIWSCGIALYVLLIGRLPFPGKNKREILEKIQTTQLVFEGRQWDKVSAEAIELLKKLLCKDHLKRPSAKTCLTDPWFKDFQLRRSQVRKASFGLTKRISKYYATNHFVSVIESYIAFLKISQKDKNQLKRLFQVLDRKKTGKIDINDILEAYSLVEGQQNEEQVLEIIRAIDKNNSGAIDFSEFQVVMYGKRKLFVEQSLKQAFDHFDFDQSGFIEKQQLSDILQGCENVEFEVLLQHLDINKDEKISKDEFMQYFERLQFFLPEQE